MINKLKEMRENANITQEQLARNLDISTSTIRNIETGRSIPNVVIAIKIAKKIGTNVESIFNTE